MKGAGFREFDVMEGHWGERVNGAVEDGGWWDFRGG